MLAALKRIRFSIVNPKIVHDKNQIKSDPRLSFYPIVGFKETKTGAMLFNKPDNNNNVTQQCADELYRFLSSYHHDHTVENVWIQNKGPSFSGGADYEELVNKTHYLDKLMRLSIMIGQFNKPIFAKVHGSVKGISAYILTMFSTPLGTEKSSLRLDETSKGFVPIFGGSHKLSRLPCNIGIYLALSGDKLDEDQMARLGFLKGSIKDDELTNKQVRKHLSDANLFFRNPYTPSSHNLSQIKRENLVMFKMNYFYDMISQTQKQLFKTSEDIYSKLAINQYRIAQTQYYNTINPYNAFSDKGMILNNYYQMRHDRPFKYLKDKGILTESKTTNNILARLPIHKLIKVFNHDNIYDVLEELKKDDSQWARQTEEKIRAKDPLAVHLTFHLIKNATSLSWVEALENEYKIARRLLNISKVENADLNDGGSIKKLTSKYSKLKAEDIPREIISNFFKPYQNESEIFDHDTPNHSLLPTSQYWKKVPDAARNYLNRTFFEDYHSKFGQIEVRRFLHLNKIDYRDRSYNIPTLREYLYKEMDYEKLIDIEKQRIKAILQSEIFYTKLKEQRMKYAGQQIKSPQFIKMITAEIEAYFENKFVNRFQDLKDTAKIAGKQARMGIIRKYVGTLIENIVKKGNYIEEVTRAHNARHDGIVRFDDKGSDAFHAQNQYQKSFKELNIIKQAYKTKNEGLLSEIEEDKLKPEYVLYKNEYSEWEQDLMKKDAALRLNYNKAILPRQIAAKYRRLIQKAAKTSQEIAGFLGWENSDIEAIITNAPKTGGITFRQFAQNAMKNTQQIQKRIQLMNIKFEALQKIKAQDLPKLLSQKPEQSIGHVFFDSQTIPRPFRDVHLQLFNQVLKFFSQKYQINQQLVSSFDPSKQNIMNQWVAQGLNTNFSKLMKNDVEYVFSYLALMHLKEILSGIQEKNFEQMHQIKELLQKEYGVNIAGFSKHQFNTLFMKYLYQMLDLHEESKHKIIFPQSKMIQFLNTLKIQKDIGPQGEISFETLILLIAKDRKMIHDYQNGKIPLLGYDPQFNLNTLATEHEKYKAPIPIYEELQATDEDDKNEIQPAIVPIQNMQNLSPSQSLTQKYDDRLVIGFPHYLRRLEGMMQRAAGSTMFLPKNLYQQKSKKTYEFIKDLLKTQISNKEWFKNKIKSAVANLFDYRLQHEKHMNLGELELFDQQFAEFFSPELIGLVIKYEIHAEESIAKYFLDQNQEILQSTNSEIKNKYLELKSQIKNPRALKMLNNLIMTKNVIKNRTIELNETDDVTITKKEIPTNQQRNDLTYQKNRLINPRTIARLAHETFRYTDHGSRVNQKNIKQARMAIVGKTQQKSSKFLSQLKEIEKILQASDLRTQLQDRIRRVQAFQASQS